MRTRDDLYDALDRLPRPVKLYVFRGRTIVESADEWSKDTDKVTAVGAAEDVVVYEYFTNLRAEEKITP